MSSTKPNCMFGIPPFHHLPVDNAAAVLPLDGPRNPLSYWPNHTRTHNGSSRIFAYTTFCEAPGQINPSQACRVFRNPGDIVVAVNGIATADKSFDETCHLIQEQSYMFLRMVDLQRYRQRRHQQQALRAQEQQTKKARGRRNLHEEQEDSWWEAPMKDYQQKPTKNKQQQEADKIVAMRWIRASIPWSRSEACPNGEKHRTTYAQSGTCGSLGKGHHFSLYEIKYPIEKGW